MVITIQQHVSLLQSFLSNPTSTPPQQAAEAALHITRAAAQSTAPKSAIALAQTTLATLSRTPCIPAIPHLLSICDNDPFEALDVFVLSSAAWKALVAAAITAPLEPHLAMRVISCAALNATSMIARCLHPSTQTSTEVLRTVKIAKFYCLNAARCSRAFSNTIQHLSPQLLGAPFLQLFDLLALSSFVLLFDHHALLSAHDELHAEVVPLVTKTLKTLLAMTQDLSQGDFDRILRRALEATGKHQTFVDLCLPAAVLQLLAVLHVTRCAVDMNEVPNKSQQRKTVNHGLVCSVLLPFLFDCFDVAYEEIVLFREQGGGGAFLDTVTTATVDCISAVEIGAEPTDNGYAELDFLLEQVSSDNVVRSHVAQEALLHMATLQTAHDGWREPVTSTVLACLRISLTLDCEQVERWQRLAVELCSSYVQDGKPLTPVLATSRRLCDASESRKSDPSANHLHDPITILLLAGLCDRMSPCDMESTSSDATHHSQIQGPTLPRVLDGFQLDAAKVITHAKDLALTSTGYGAANAISLLPHVLDSKSACGAAISVLQRESSTTPMVCAALNILDPSTMQPATVNAACAAATNALFSYGAIVCPAVSAFVSRAAFLCGETVSLAQWQQLSGLLESCVITSQRDAELSAPVSRAVAGAVLHHSATALSAIRNCSRDDRQTQATVPSGILSGVEDALERLHRWRGGENGCDMAEERSLLREERILAETPVNCDPADGMKAIRAIRAAKERLLEAASLLLDETNTVCMNEEVKEELSLLQDSVRCIARCQQPPRQ